MTLPAPKDGDSLPTGLGPLVPRPQAPVPAPSPTGTPGIVQRPDGKLETRIPENERARWGQPHSFLGGAS